MGQPRPLFCLFLIFSNTKFTEKTAGIRGIRTWIIGVEGEHADHLTTTTALNNDIFHLQARCKIVSLVLSSVCQRLSTRCCFSGSSKLRTNLISSSRFWNWQLWAAIWIGVLPIAFFVPIDVDPTLRSASTIWMKNKILKNCSCPIPASF